MKYMRMGLVLFLFQASAIFAEVLTISSFDRGGKLTFDSITNAASYRVEWASSPSGPWTNSWTALTHITAPTNGSVTCSVPMFYRVVAEMGIPMVQITAGTNAGTDPDFGAYSLTVIAFYMDETEITKRQWNTVKIWAEANGYSFDNPGAGKGDNHPVEWVNWYDCIKWCNARSEREGLTPYYTMSNSVYRVGQITPDRNFSANGYRLPMTTEWEYAARGGLVSQRFAWGNTITHDQANYDSRPDLNSYDLNTSPGYHPLYNTGSGTYPYSAPVRSFASNGYGLYEMMGNMSEWCWSPAATKPLKGGSWWDKASGARCRYSRSIAPDSQGTDTGFRTIRNQQDWEEFFLEYDLCFLDKIVWCFL